MGVGCPQISSHSLLVQGRRYRGGGGGGGGQGSPTFKSKGAEPLPHNNRLDATIPRDPSTNLQLCHLVSWGLASLTCSAKHEGATRVHSDN